MSKGIGFGKKQGENVEIPRNAKQYKMQKSYQAKQKSNNIFDYIDPMYIEISSEIITLTKEKFGITDFTHLEPHCFRTYFFQPTFYC